jgi:hypothetical protein
MTIFVYQHTISSILKYNMYTRFWLMSLTLIDVARYKSRYSCTIIYFDRPDSFCELVTWPTKISDDKLAFLLQILMTFLMSSNWSSWLRIIKQIQIKCMCLILWNKKRVIFSLIAIFVRYMKVISNEPNK